MTAATAPSLANERCAILIVRCDYAGLVSRYRDRLSGLNLIHARRYLPFCIDASEGPTETASHLAKGTWKPFSR